MIDDTIEIRTPADDPDALREFIRPATLAFADDYSDAMFEVDRQLWEVDRLVGAVDGETWVGTAAAISMRLTVPGGEIRVAGLSDVGVAPTHRRRGILTRMMRWLLDQASERGEPVVILHASEGAIYPHFGFGLATLQGSFEVDRSAFRFARPVEPIGRVRFVGVEEGMGIIPPVFDQVRVGRVGEITRTPARWRTQLLADDGRMKARLGVKFNAVLEVDGVPRGYVIYRVKDDWDERGPKNMLSVLEVVGLDPAAERALWEWVSGVDLVGRIRGLRTAVPPSLFLELAEPRRLGATITDGVWVRLVDLPAALAARSYRGPGAVTLEVTDAFIPANAGLWTLDVPGDRGVATVERAASGVEADLAVDTTGLATVYLGAFTFADLVRAGRAEERRPAAAASADRLFTTADVPWSATMF